MSGALSKRGLMHLRDSLYQMPNLNTTKLKEFADDFFLNFMEMVESSPKG